ncbi:biotin biosynthesis protein BioC [Pigmentiphaga humi]|uniref:Biotin biosynthesis protein BioC n=1 Tax=Pigmentiphaga humi TaxID=2478468 RepID=A0A3P4B3F0_9BURK|nr:class I SAM-dependent methyltransferase [Pigmentiphaga humi]VCU70441.1 biotin biosynthesis protein BioC [Pigmentiphaga humi]
MTDFEALYRNHPDPWSVRSAWYERRKLGLLMAALPRERYRCALELGCGTGQATVELAARSDAVLAVDGAPTAAARCQEALAQRGTINARVYLLDLPGQWPLAAGAAVDLIVVSELAYYFSDDALRRFIQCCSRSLAPGGDWAMCHYTLPFHDRLQDTARLHRAVDDTAGLRRIVTHDDARFRLDIWRKHEGAAP